MHLVIGSAGYAGRSAIAALSVHFPVRGVELGDDLGTAMAGIDTVHLAADLHSPLRRLRWQGPGSRFCWSGAPTTPCSHSSTPSVPSATCRALGLP